MCSEVIRGWSGSAIDAILVLHLREIHDKPKQLDLVVDRALNSRLMA